MEIVSQKEMITADGKLPYLFVVIEAGPSISMDVSGSG